MPNNDVITNKSDNKSDSINEGFEKWIETKKSESFYAYNYNTIKETYEAGQHSIVENEKALTKRIFKLNQDISELKDQIKTLEHSKKEACEHIGELQAENSELRALLDISIKELKEICSDAGFMSNETKNLIKDYESIKKVGGGR